jgi:alkylation response protein AidB-like acyl-CoA dehydrogenase/acyl-CoA synthetase (AMP-forming)/AMP-acid ligase II
MQETIAASTPTTAPAALDKKGLIDWLENPTSGRGLHFADDDGGWTFWEYPRLAGLVAEAAERIEDKRIREAGPVSIAIPSGPDFVAAFLGTLVAGHTPSPLALPIFLRDPDKYIRHVAAILEAADPALVLADPALLEQLTQAAEYARLATAPVALDAGGDHDVPLNPRTPAELALLQFTSGSSGHPRGVRVTWDNLETNLAQIGRWLQGRPNEETIGTWLPLYHDMGLIGALLWPMVNQFDIWILRPDQFIRDPLRWLELFGKHGATIGVAPNFGFAYADRRISDEQLEGMDFSSWKATIAAAERLDPEVLTTFAHRLEPYGFKASAFVPAYGLAEGTLAVTGLPLGETPRTIRPRWDDMGFGQEIVVEETGRLGDRDRFGSGAGWLVSCGRELDEVAVSIVDDEGNDLPDGHVGEIKVEGPNVAHGYTAQGGGSTRFEGDALLSGDAGLIVDGELYVLGRIGDSLKVRGRTVFVEDIEAQIAAADGISKGKVVVLAGADGKRNMLAAVVEATRGAWVHEVSRILEAEVGGEASIKIVASPPRTIQRTSSGKPRRRVMWKDFVNGSVPGELVFSTAEGQTEQEAPDPLLARGGGMHEPEVEAYRMRVREIVGRQVAPHVEAAERERRFPRAVIASLGEERVLRERWVGSDHGDAGKAVLLAEELGRAATGGVGVGVSVHLEVVLSILRRFGETDALRELREQALDGKLVGCVAASERANGSDLASIETVAVQDGDGWRIRGEKRYVSVGAAADFALVLAREHDAETDTPVPALTLFAVPSDGFTVSERLEPVGNRGLETVTIELDANVPDDLVLSRPGRGLHAITWGLTHERLAAAAHALGAASLALELATAHAEHRVQFGSRLIAHQGVRMRLGALASELWLARAGVYALAFSLREVRTETARHVAAAKVTAANLAERVVSDCMQVLGGRGYLEDASPLARLWRDVRFARIGGGTDEMMWELVAAGLQGDDELYERFVRSDP